MHSYSPLSYCLEKTLQNHHLFLCSLCWLQFCQVPMNILVYMYLSMTLTCSAGCPRAPSWWWFPPPPSLDSSCRRLEPLPTTHCSRQLDLGINIIILPVKQAEWIRYFSVFTYLFTAVLNVAYQSLVYLAG